MDISVVVPTFRRPSHLSACLDALAGQDAGDFEVVVVDDGSGDETSALLQSAATRVSALRWESLPGNRGPAAARNRAVEMATGQWVLFIDDDIVASPGLVGTHLKYLHAGDPHLGVVGKVEWLPTLEVTPFMHWLDDGDVQFDFAHMTPGPVDPPRRAFYTCNVSLSRDLLLSVGGFDERFPYPAYEDTELAVRLTAAGFHLDYRPVALAWHGRSIALGDFVARMTKVGEAAVILRNLHPEVAAGVDLDRPCARGWKGLARRALLAAGPLAERGRLRSRYYQHTINDAFCAGVAAGRAH